MKLHHYSLRVVILGSILSTVCIVLDWFTPDAFLALILFSLAALLLNAFRPS